MTSGRFNVGGVADVATSASSTEVMARAVILSALSVATTLLAVARALLSWALSTCALGGLGRRTRVCCCSAACVAAGTDVDVVASAKDAGSL